MQYFILFTILLWTCTSVDSFTIIGSFKCRGRPVVNGRVRLYKNVTDAGDTEHGRILDADVTNRKGHFKLSASLSKNPLKQLSIVIGEDRVRECGNVLSVKIFGKLAHDRSTLQTGSHEYCCDKPVDYQGQVNSVPFGVKGTVECDTHALPNIKTTLYVAESRDKHIPLDTMYTDVQGWFYVSSSGSNAIQASQSDIFLVLSTKVENTVCEMQIFFSSSTVTNQVLAMYRPINFCCVNDADQSTVRITFDHYQN